MRVIDQPWIRLEARSRRSFLQTSVFANSMHEGNKLHHYT